MRKPADAERYAVETAAEAAKTRALRESRGRPDLAERQQRRRCGAEGEAEAAAILARGEAEAAAMQKKADAYGQYGDAAVLEMLSSMLPRLVREAAAPIGAIDKVTVISTEGASELTKSVASNVTQGMQLASDLLGIDLGAMFQRIANGDRAALTPPPASRDVAEPGGRVAAASGGGDGEATLGPEPRSQSRPWRTA